MDKRENVIKGLECCINNERATPDCMRCPYAEINGICTGLHKLHGDALALLKAQEPEAVIRSKDYIEGLITRCPKCKNKIYKYNGCYCPTCGQVVKWE